MADSSEASLGCAVAALEQTVKLALAFSWPDQLVTLRSLIRVAVTVYTTFALQT